MPVLLPSGFRPGPARITVRIPVGERGGVAAWRASDGARSALFMPKDPSAEADQQQQQRLLLGPPGRVWSAAGGPGEDGSAKEVDDRLEDIDSLRQGLLSMDDMGEEGGDKAEGASRDGGGEGAGWSVDR